MTANEEIGIRLGQLRKERGFTNCELSQKSGVPVTTLNHILRGYVKNPGVITLMKLCKGLDITMIDFFDKNDMENI